MDCKTSEVDKNFANKILKFLFLTLNFWINSVYCIFFRT